MGLKDCCFCFVAILSRRAAAFNKMWFCLGHAPT
ncbi:hypothetical protein TR2A62_1893 [Thalassobium sp. R2A62]|nr:hypothetical protein TR2A62_1893 [Thalassobium sp. R2A62]